MNGRSVLRACLLVWVALFIGCGPTEQEERRGPLGYTHKGMDFDGDGKDDELVVEELEEAVELRVGLPAGSRRTVELATVHEEVGYVIVCDYTGDGKLDVVYSLGEGALTFVYISKLDRAKPLHQQAEAWEGGAKRIGSFKDLGANAYVVKNLGDRKFAPPERLSAE